MTEESFNEISEWLDRGLITGSTMMNTFRMLDENSRQTPAYLDARYAPFYYYLGRCCQCKSLMEFGFGLGIGSGSYVRGCNTVEHILAFQQTGKNYYSPRLGIHNVKDYFKGDLKVHVGNLTDPKFETAMNGRKYDMVIVNEDINYDLILEHMEFAWNNLVLDGTIVVDCVKYHNQVTSAYKDFCLRKNRQEMVIPTRYGAGIITK